MLDSSTAYKEVIHKSGRIMSIHDEYTFADGSQPKVGTGDFMKYSINEATSDNSTFSIGAAVIKKYTACLNNIDGRFDLYDFEGLDILARVGVQLPDGTIEIIPKGKYRCVKPTFTESTIEIEAYDSMIFFDKPYTESTLKFPATILQIVGDACLHCQMQFDAKSIRNGDYVVEERPDDSNLTFRDMISYCAQIMCCFARIDKLDQLSFGWYDFEVLERLQNGYDGGNLYDYTSGDTFDGGNFTDYFSGDTFDGGNFDQMKTFHHLYSLGSQSINTDDVFITGVNVMESNQEKDEKFLYGEEGYVLSIEENPLIQSGQKEIVANYIGKKIVGKRFRPLSISCQSDPCIEAGDCACVTDRKQRTFFTIITNTTFALGALQTVECTAETPTEKNFTKYSASTKLLHKAKNQTERKLGAYDLAVQQLTNLMTQSFGVFKSEEVLADGSVIYYMHNKPERVNSSTIWKITADAFAVSTDGGKTWNAGFDSSGNAVVNVLNAIGINADWMNAGSILIGGAQRNENGTITVFDKNGAVLFKVSKDGIIINTKNFTISQNGNVEMFGKLTGLDKLHIRNEIQGTDKPVIRYKWSAENSSYEFLDPDGNVIMRTSQNEVPLYLPLAVGIKSAEIQGLHNKTSIDFGGTDGENFSVSGKVIKSGIFILLYGSLAIERIEAGKSISCVINLGSEQELAPTRKGVTVATSAGGRCILVNLDTSGKLTVKNLGTTDYVGSDESTIGFRMDYILI